MVHLREFVKINQPLGNEYPNNLKLIKDFASIKFDHDITIFVGDNGSGKTTFMNLLASTLNVNRIDFPENQLMKVQKLSQSAKDYKAIYNLSKVTGFFFQGEEFINYQNYLNATITNCYEELKRIDIEYRDKSEFSYQQARSPYLQTLGDLKRLYSYSLLERSHGEGFIDFFKSRLRNNQIYLLDEPETPLSFSNLLLMIALIKESANNRSQFIIATHSPVLMAIPNAKIYEITDGGFVSKEYEELEAVYNLKQFLNNKEAYLRHL